MLKDNSVDASNFLKEVEKEGKLIQTYETKNNSDNKVLIYEYIIDDKSYNIVILKEKGEYLNFFIKVV